MRVLLDGETDLFGLAQLVAQNAGGMVSIEDPESHVLAYSASDEAADPLRIRSILGREGPHDYLRMLREWGVFDRLRRTDEVIEVPAHPELNIKRRLVISIRRPSADAGVAPRLLGSIWLQQGDRAFEPGAPEVLRGASAIAARIISRILDAPSTEALMVQRLFGVRGEGVDIPSIAGALGIPAHGPAAVVGFAALTGAAARSDGSASAGETADDSLGGLIRLHSSAFRRDAVTMVYGARIYVLLPRFRSERAVTAWVRQLVERFEREQLVPLHAAIAIPVADLAAVAGARSEVDRVLDSPPAAFAQGRVTTLAESRTAVLLGEIVGLLRGKPELRDPRLEALADYDSAHSANLGDSVEVYLRVHGDVRAAAQELRVHPNTLRYRIRRVEQLTGMSLADPADRLLLELQLALRESASSRGER
ncbi:PucR family transcriptional regulator [Nocardia goodfellowii]|uniref:DNA-binding PucR family transcriptional regulator n=1 Tax=Nocardia goodfellowii TaxID=882446 RepID=A0ABS4QNX7_9NOCA|nr:PucR family transcriptional regulator [Nocardia goodfellowii]MBP2192830.1 DNA-binding PucR family transcriptional regulator [Nocardia goodfellowii]